MKKWVMTAAALATATLAPATAQAAVLYLANGTLTGSAAGVGVDLSGLTAPLENGQAGNILGGLGSGLAYAGGNTFLATPDRGPNAVSYNSAIDDTTSYISRFQTLSLALTPSTGGALPFTLSPTLTGTTLLYSPTSLFYGSGAGLGTRSDGTPLGSGAPAINTASANYFTGRSDGFAPGSISTAVGNARFDPESIRVSGDGKSVFISDEYGPYIRQFDRATGKLLNTVALPANLAVTNQSPKGDTEIDVRNNPVGRIANKGMEGLAITPDGKTLVGIMQANLEQDPVSFVRIVTVNIASGETRQYGYKLTTGSGVSDIVAINDHQFLVDERDGKGLGDGSAAKTKQVFQIDLNGATDISALSGAAAAAATSVTKASSPFIDLVARLGLAANQVPAKIEGLAFGQDVSLNGANYHTLFVANDNDFVPNVAGPNQFFVFGFQDADLPGFVPQAITAAVPEPSSWATMTMAIGAIGALLRRRRTAAKVSPALA